MSAVQDADFTFFIRLNIICPYDIGIGLMDREFVSPFFITFDDPKIEELARVEEVVFIAQLFLEIRDFIPGISL